MNKMKKKMWMFYQFQIFRLKNIYNFVNKFLKFGKDFWLMENLVKYFYINK